MALSDHAPYHSRIVIVRPLTIRPRHIRRNLLGDLFSRVFIEHKGVAVCWEKEHQILREKPAGATNREIHATAAHENPLKLGADYRAVFGALEDAVFVLETETGAIRHGILFDPKNF